MSSFNYEEYRRSKKKYKNKRYNNGNKKNSIKVRCIETNEIFDSIGQGELRYCCDIRRYFRGKSKYAGKLPDGTKLHWEKVV